MISMTSYSLYREGKTYFISCEHLYGKPDLALHRDEIYEAGNENQKLPEYLRNEIALEVKMAVQSRCCQVEIIPPLFDVYDSINYKRVDNVL
jgi:hypothetical protein